jgi:choline dehydrogenase-like flavoprotein
LLRGLDVTTRLRQASAVPHVLGNTSLDAPFDVVIIGSGAGGSAAAHVLTAAGLKVLILEAGNNYFPGLDNPDDLPFPLFSNDELKMGIRGLITQDPIIEPRTFRQHDGDVARAHPDVNVLARNVGGTTVHADMKYPRFNTVDFRLASVLQSAGRTFDGAAFADWPVTYEELEPFYAEAEILSGVSGIASGDGADPFASPRGSTHPDYPLPPTHEMYVGRVLANGARLEGYHPMRYPAAVNSRPYDGRPACVSCGFCSGFGCPNNSKGSAAVTTLRKALLTGNCQVRFNSFVRALQRDASGSRITAVEYIDDDGDVQTVKAQRFVLAASAIESARLCFLSDPSGPGLGNEHDQLGRYLMFHFQTTSVGIFKQRLHGERGLSVSNGMSDFRGVVEGGDALRTDFPFLGGVIEFGTSSEPIRTSKQFLRPDALQFANLVGLSLKELLVAGPFQSHIAVMTMQAEDAPQFTNHIDLDPTVRDAFGLPVPRVTYSNHPFELGAAEFYKPKMLEVIGAAGAQFGFTEPFDPTEPPSSRHVMGGLRMGADPQSSVCDKYGKLHAFDNLYCADGGVFVTSSGYNPTLTLIALSLRMAGHIVAPGNAERTLSHG